MAAFLFIHSRKYTILHSIGFYQTLFVFGRRRIALRISLLRQYNKFHLRL